MATIKDTSHFDEMEGKMVRKLSYDNTDVLEANKVARNATPEFGKYKTSNSGLAHVGRIDMGDVVRLKNEGYDLLSPDREEVKRALLHIQQNEPFLLTVEGKPFAKKKQVWV